MFDDQPVERLHTLLALIEQVRDKDTAAAILESLLRYSTEFGWNANKAEAKLRKHGVDFDEATTVFGDPLAGSF